MHAETYTRLGHRVPQRVIQKSEGKRKGLRADMGVL
jgi:hypothetical protein